MESSSVGIVAAGRWAVVDAPDGHISENQPYHLDDAERANRETEADYEDSGAPHCVVPFHPSSAATGPTSRDAGERPLPAGSRTPSYSGHSPPTENFLRGFGPSMKSAIVSNHPRRDS